MITTDKERLALVLFLISGTTISITLILFAFSANLTYYFEPAEIKAGTAPIGQVIQVGGLVVPGSLQRDPNSLLVKFVITDNQNTLAVQYTGILPDLFSEGQGTIATGKLQADGTFLASDILAKHDENYMPPAVADSLKPPLNP